MSDLGEVIPLLLVLGGLVAASAFFSGTEVAMFSLRRIDRERMLRSKRSDDSLALRLLAHPRRLITTVLIGNEAVNVSVSAVAASLIAYLFAGSTELRLVFLSTAVVLPLLLLVGEITPKALAMKTSVSWSRAATRPLWLFGLIVSPIGFLVRSVVDLLVRPFAGSAASAESSRMTENEFRALVQAGSAVGEVDAREHRIIDSVFEFDGKSAEQVMVPRADIFALAANLSLSSLTEEIGAHRYSRVPIYEESLDNIVGIVHARDLVAVGAGISAPRHWRTLLHAPLFVPATVPLEQLFRLFKQRKTHMALVVSQSDEFLGLVTMENLLEELFGKIHDGRGQRNSKSTMATATQAEVAT